MKFFKSLLSFLSVNPFTVQNDLLITFSLCHSSADYNWVPQVVCK